jgi:hypothetical protein
MAQKDDRTRRHLTIGEATALLSRTPRLLDAWLRDLPDAWLRAHEGGASWSPSDVVSHLILGEQTNWMPRLRHILEHGEHTPFAPFRRFTESAAPIADRLDEFASLRTANLHALAALGLDEITLQRTGAHPALGTVTIRQLLAAWVAHDLDHVTQIARVMASQYSDEVGPWRVYLRIISGHPSQS